jgi:hypothetical protein
MRTSALQSISFSGRAFTAIAEEKDVDDDHAATAETGVASSSVFQSPQPLH